MAGRSVGAEHRLLVEQALRPGEPSVIKRARRRLAAMRGRPCTDSAELIRADRDANYEPRERIVDASVAEKWFVFEDGSEQTLELLGRSLAAPAIWLAEASNALRTKCAKGRAQRE